MAGAADLAPLDRRGLRRYKGRVVESRRVGRTEDGNVAFVAAGFADGATTAWQYELERLYRQAPMLLIGEGTADIQRMIIGRRLLNEYRSIGS